jgi:hypothetical protein
MVACPFDPQVMRRAAEQRREEEVGGAGRGRGQADDTSGEGQRSEANEPQNRDVPENYR